MAVPVDIKTSIIGALIIFFLGAGCTLTGAAIYSAGQPGRDAATIGELKGILANRDSRIRELAEADIALTVAKTAVDARLSSLQIKLESVYGGLRTIGQTIDGLSLTSGSALEAARRALECIGKIETIIRGILANQ